MLETILTVCFLSISCIVFVGIIWCLLMLIKNENTCKNHIIISQAICDYNCSLIEMGKFDECINYDDMEEYEKTLKRFWDWGYKRILPPQQFELIKPFIKSKREGRK